MANIISHSKYLEGDHVEAKRLILHTLAMSVDKPDDSTMFERLFGCPEDVAVQTGVLLSKEDATALRCLGTEGFSNSWQRSGGSEVVAALVKCLERLDMPDVSKPAGA